MADDKRQAEIMTEGFLALLASGALSAGKLAEWEHTECRDCEWYYAEGVLARSACKSQAPEGPRWPGCRAFKLHDGAPGPVKRAHEAAQKAHNEAEAKLRAQGGKP